MTSGGDDPEAGSAEARRPRFDQLDPEAAFHLERITEVLVATAKGKFDVKAPRNHRGDPWDVLSFLVNETSEEVEQLVLQLRGEREKVQAAYKQLSQAEKLTALGEIARGIAHELNQPLTVMQALAELLLEKPERTIEERRKEIELIAAAARRMGRIVQGVRTFGRQAPLRLSQMSVLEAWDSALRLMEEPLRIAGIDVIVEKPESLPLVAGDSEALSQVFVNLLSNARDVLEELAPGTPRVIKLRIELTPTELLARFSDSGPGISLELADRIFDPFFSTKTVGRGTGLGLAICQSILLDHHGSLTVDNPGEPGACFALRLPILLVAA